jgi:hypothetical protein
MAQLISIATDGLLGAAVVSALAFGFAPILVLRLLVLVYPADDARRRELVAEVHCIPRVERLIWVSEQLATVLFDGFTARRNARAAKQAAEAEERRRRFMIHAAEVTMGAAALSDSQESARHLGKSQMQGDLSTWDLFDEPPEDLP